MESGIFEHFQVPHDTALPGVQLTSHCKSSVRRCLVCIVTDLQGRQTPVPAAVTVSACCAHVLAGLQSNVLADMGSQKPSATQVSLPSNLTGYSRS